MQQAILLFGGISDERLVSVATAQNLAGRFPFAELWFEDPQGRFFAVSAGELAAHQRPYEIPFAVKSEPFAANLAATANRIGARAVFLGFHGTEGEDGELQRWLEDKRIPFTGSDAKVSQLCFEKTATKDFLQKTAVPLAPQIVITRRDPVHENAERLQAFAKKHGKIVVKPVASGSSVGLHILAAGEDPQTVAREVSTSDYDLYLVEAFIAGREITVAVIDDQIRGLIALPASEAILLSGPKFDYAGKYLGRGTKEVTPAEISLQEMQATQKLALDVHRALGCYGYSRSDMILTSTGPVYLETNTLPGLTKASFVPQQLAAAGIDMADFIARQIELAFTRAR